MHKDDYELGPCTMKRKAVRFTHTCTFTLVHMHTDTHTQFICTLMRAHAHLPTCLLTHTHRHRHAYAHSPVHTDTHKYTLTRPELLCKLLPWNRCPHSAPHAGSHLHTDLARGQSSGPWPKPLGKCATDTGAWQEGSSGVTSRGWEGGGQRT